MIVVDLIAILIIAELVYIVLHTIIYSKPETNNKPNSGQSERPLTIDERIAYHRGELAELQYLKAVTQPCNGNKTKSNNRSRRNQIKGR